MTAAAGKDAKKDALESEVLDTYDLVRTSDESKR